MVKSVASARRTQLVTTYGVGALLPSMDESFMICGIDEWDLRNSTEVSEPRLARSLQVQTFRMPPSGPGDRRRDVPVIRFPETYFCPNCRRLGPRSDFCAWDEHRCPDCARDLSPSRFVVCCANGHTDEFPYFLWSHQGQGAAEGHERHQLRLTARGRTSSLADIEISCSCGIQPVSMAGSFGPRALERVTRCTGKRPWLAGAPDEDCDELPRTLQRGSSNVWFGMLRSALSIPPWSEGAFRLLDRHWPLLKGIPSDQLEQVLDGMHISTPDAPVEALARAIRERRGESDTHVPTDEDLRADEYKALVAGRPEQSASQQFVCVEVEFEPELSDVVAQVSKVARLREVRALEGFTRVLPPGPGMDPSRRARLTVSAPTWLPAIEVLGEGVFVRVHEDHLATWEATPFALARAAAIREAATLSQAPTTGPVEEILTSPRQLLLHSFAHILLNELSLDAGYPAASLRERIFAEPGQCGVLVYTASADSAGSLGGLAAQAHPDRFTSVLLSAVRRAAWCSADPVCMESEASGNGALNLAACHACLLLPETSCENLNSYLDRATVVGLPGEEQQGFFGSLLLG